MESKLNLNRKQNYIFDLDGTLIDSMWIWDNLLIDFLAGYGYETPKSLLNEVAYMSMEQSSRRVAELYDLSMTPKQIENAWTEMIYDGYAHRIKLKRGAGEYLEGLKRSGKNIALASASSRELAEACLKNNGIFEYFDVFTYVDEVGIGKTSPKIYTETLRRLNADNHSSILFEDIFEALKSAKSIGLDVVIVEDTSAKKDRGRLKAGADIYIEDFTSPLLFETPDFA